MRRSIDHIHDVLSAILRSAVKWGHLQANPARGVEMLRLKTIRPKWALTVDQATALAAQWPWLLPRTLVGLALLTGLRRGELFALRWWDIDEPNRSLQVRAAVYEGVFDDPKTVASLRTIPLPNGAHQSGHDDERLHAGARWRGAVSCGSRRIGIVQSCSDPGRND